MKKNHARSISEIARECHVSTMTVSRALRNNPAVKEETRRKIFGVAERLGYIRSPRLGRPAAGGDRPAMKIQLIAGVMGRSMAIFQTQLLASIEQQLAVRGCECVIRTCNEEYQQFVQLLANVCAAKAEAAIIVGSFTPEQLRSLLEAAPGAVLLDNPGDPAVEGRYSVFAFDNAEAGRIGVRHLLDCGRRRILLLTGTPGHFFSREIEQGYRESLVCRGCGVDENLILHADFTAESAHAAIACVLQRGLKFDAVFTNDEMASGVYRALLERGLRIPQDIAVCGCDGLPIGTHLFPQLTSIVLDYEALGKMAIKHILEDGEDVPTPYRLRMLPLIAIRESTVSTEHNR